jgi:3-hydroxybutyryl-CoA dehydrogenase
VPLSTADCRLPTDFTIQQKQGNNTVNEQPIENILIVGSGTMGRQIGLHFAIHGCRVTFYDLNDTILEKATSGIRTIADTLVKMGLCTAEQASAGLGRIRTSSDPADAAKDIDLISESVPEDPKLKADVLSTFHGLCPEHTIFTTNTSTLCPSQFARECGRPEKLLAFHFHDLRITPVVDIMPHPQTDPVVVRRVEAFAKRMGLIAIVLLRENPGYVFNAMFSALLLSAQTLAANEVASIEDIDRSWMGVTNMPIGPFGLMDSVGIDTVWKITDYWAKRTGEQQRAKNAAYLKRYVDEGALGVTTGRGFYAYPKPAYRRAGFLQGVEPEGARS